MPRENLHRWKRADQLKAEWLDQMRKGIEAAGRKQGAGYYSSGWSASQDIEYSRIKWVRMTQAVGVQSSSGFINQPGSIVVLNTVTGTWEEIDNRVQLSSAFYDLPFDDEQLIPCHVHQGKLVPLWVQTVRHAVTVADSGDYPLETMCPNTYPIKYVEVSYIELAGAQEPSVSYLDPTEEPDDFVLNLYKGENSYLPEGTLIEIYSVTKQWFTFAFWTPDECESSSSSSSSLNSSSSNSSSDSSSSTSSSDSSSSDSSSSDSSISFSSSSQSVSGSSSDSSVSEGSSASSSETQNSSSGGSEECDKAFPEDITLIDGYDGTATQLLGHSIGGCLLWINTAGCP